MFAKRMTAFLTEKGSPDMNLFLTHCLTTLAHMHLANLDNPGYPAVKSSAIADIFRGKKASTVLNLVINIANHFASPETKMHWKEKTEIIMMVTVISSAISESVKSSEASSVDTSNLRRLLEKAKIQENSRVVCQVLLFVSSLSSLSPAPPLKVTIEELVRKNRKDPENMFLSQISVEFFAQSESQSLVADMMRSLLHCICDDLQGKLSSQFQLLQDRTLFIQQLNEVVPQSLKLRHAVLNALTSSELVLPLKTLIESCRSRPCPSTDSCGGSEYCFWKVSNLRNRLQSLLLSLILRCAIFSQTEQDAKLPPPHMIMAILERLTQCLALNYTCPLEVSQSEKPAKRPPLSLFEEFASPGARLTSHDWRQALREKLAWDSERQYGFVVMAVGEICRDLEDRCDNVERPLRDELQKSEQLQFQVYELERKCADVEEQLERSLQDLDITAEENELLEGKLASEVAKTKDARGRINELEKDLSIAQDAARRAAESTKREQDELKRIHEEELATRKDEADRAAVEHLEVLAVRQNLIDELQEYKTGLDIQITELTAMQDSLSGEKTCLQNKVTALTNKCEDIQHELGETMSSYKATSDELSSVRSDLEARQTELQNSCIELATVRRDLEESEAALTEIKKDVKQQDAQIQELICERQQQGDEIMVLKKSCSDLQELIDSLKSDLENTVIDSEQRRNALRDELCSSHTQEVSALRTNYETTVSQLKTKIDGVRKSWSEESSRLRQEIKSLSDKLGQLRHVQQEREKEAQSLGRKLLGLMSDTSPALQGDPLLSNAPPAPNSSHFVRRESSASPLRRPHDGDGNNEVSVTTTMPSKRVKNRHTYSSFGQEPQQNKQQAEFIFSTQISEDLRQAPKARKMSTVLEGDVFTSTPKSGQTDRRVSSFGSQDVNSGDNGASDVEVEEFEKWDELNETTC